MRFIHNTFQTETDKCPLDCAIAAREVLKPTADALYRIWELVSSQLRTCEHDIEVYRNRGYLFSLPDEILSMVLDYAALHLVLGEKNEIISTVKAAIKLSHVCKRFRDLITHSSILWKSVFNEMGSIGMVSMCMSRCMTANAEIFLTRSFYKTRASGPSLTKKGDQFAPFVRAVMEKSENWRSFTLCDSFLKPRRELEFGQLQELADLTKGLSVPNLSKLAIYYPEVVPGAQLQTRTDLHDALHYYSTWFAPTLRSMTMHYMVPIPFSGTLSITSLTIILHLSVYDTRGDKVAILDVKSLVSFLSVCPALVEFALQVGYANNATSPASSSPRVEMTCVNKLDLRLSCCHASPLKMLFDAVRFPHVTKMRLYIKSCENEKKRDMHFSNIFNAVLPDVKTFPKLVEMNLTTDAGSSYDRTDFDTCPTISIPFAIMPGLRTFKLQTYATEVQGIPDGLPLPAIRRLILQDCHRLDKNWLVQFLTQLKAQGDLDLLRVSTSCCRYFLRPQVEGLLSKEDILKFVA